MEVEALVKEMTGASKVLIFDHTFRSTESDPKVLSNHMGIKNKAAAPAAMVHADYSKDSGPKRLSQLQESGAYTTTATLNEEDWKKRFQIVNVWRPTSENPVINHPLAVCDTTSVSADDMKLFRLEFPTRTGEIQTLTTESAAKHAWFYYPQMTRDEALVFNLYGGETCKTGFCFHTAFEHPATPLDAPIRTSVEVRTVAFFD